MKTSEKKKRGGIRKGFVLGAIFLGMLLFVIDLGMEPFSKSEFCVRCHEMEQVHENWKQSAHHTNRSGVKVACVSCHLPAKDNFVSFTAAKVWAGSRDMCVHFFGEYNAKSAHRKAVASLSNERCVRCHSNLLGEPSSKAVGIVHGMSLEPGNSGYGCVVCHDDLHSGEEEPVAVEKEYVPTDNSYCHVCHLNFETEPLASIHVKVGVSCEDCHGESQEHADDEDNDTPPDIMYAKEQINGFCMDSKCHPQSELEKETGHRPFFAKADRKNRYCTNCHGQHYLEVRQRRWDKETRKLVEREGFKVD